MVHETKESLLQKSSEDSYLAELAGHKTDDWDVMGSISTGGFFDKFFFVLCNFRSIR